MIPNRSAQATARATTFCIVMTLLAGCSTSGAPPIEGSAQHRSGATDLVVLAATTRQKDQATIFSGERSSTLNFSAMQIVIPASHKAGATDFSIAGASYIDGDQIFLQTLNKELRTRPRGKRKVLLFIHGYNTSFVDGAFRLTQVAHDIQSPAVPVLFSWASRAALSGYVYDLNSATIARDDLEKTFRLLLRSDADEVNILAHSMGNWVAVEAMRQIVISGKRPPMEKLGHIILAAPDIDVDVFKSQMRRIGVPKKPFLVMVSKDDLALRVSSILAGGQKRIGADEDAAELNALGAVVVDLSDIHSGDRLHHGKFADLTTIGSDLPGVLRRSVDGGNGTPNNLVGSAVTIPLAVLGAPIRIFSGQP